MEASVDWQASKRKIITIIEISSEMEYRSLMRILMHQTKDLSLIVMLDKNIIMTDMLSENMKQ